MEKKVLKVDLDQLCEALEDASYEHDFYLDMESGEIIFLSEYMEDKDSKRLKVRIEKDFGRYEYIPKAESYEGHRDMQDFIATVEDERVAELLEVAINGRGAFRRFKDVLLNYPEERERWFIFKDDRMEERAHDWLDSIGIVLAEG